MTIYFFYIINLWSCYETSVCEQEKSQRLDQTISNIRLWWKVFYHDLLCGHWIVFLENFLYFIWTTKTESNQVRSKKHIISKIFEIVYRKTMGKACLHSIL